MKNNRRGFTLIELLAVIVILSGMSLIVVASISSSLERRDEKECQEQKELAINAAKIYFSLNQGTSSVSVGTLKTGKYFNEKTKINLLNDSSTISISGDGSQYVYNGECK